MNTLPFNKSSALPKGEERPKVSFGPVFEKHKTLSGREKQNNFPNLTRHKAKGYFTPNPGEFVFYFFNILYWTNTDQSLPWFIFWYVSYCVLTILCLAQSDHPSSAFGDIRPPSPLNPGFSLSDPSNPIIHPTRLTYSSFNKTPSPQQQAEKKKKVGSTCPHLHLVSWIVHCLFKVPSFFCTSLPSHLRVVIGNPWRCSSI